MGRRADELLSGAQHVPPELASLVEVAWKAVLDATTGATMHIAVARQDAVLSLLERITAPAQLLSGQAAWYSLAQRCVLDAAAHAEVEGLVRPVLLMEPVYSPLYMGRISLPGSWLPQATKVDLPIPVVLCNVLLVEEPWAWPALFHELGHHIDSACGTTLQILSKLEGDTDRLGMWTQPSWLGECVADLSAGLFGGDGAVDAIAGMLTGRAYSATHPSDSDRKAVLEATWAILKGGTPGAGDRPTDIVSRALADVLALWRDRIGQDGARDPGQHLRLQPGALFRRRREGESAQSLREDFERVAGSLPATAWSMTEARRQTLRRALSSLVETRTEGDSVPIKVPPLELLIRHDRITFVGATHGQLLERLRAVEQHRPRPHAEIEIYALTDVPLRVLNVGGKSGLDLVLERDQSLQAINEYLGSRNTRVRIRLYSQPYLFASFWDVENNATRPTDGPPAHIHFSHAPWGGDLRTAFGFDLEAPAGRPLPREMQVHVDALQSLRRISSPWTPRS